MKSEIELLRKELSKSLSRLDDLCFERRKYNVYLKCNGYEQWNSL
ncbi:hypothetical protein ABIB50_002807 [Mucilaginibacter sp. UYCu711]